jgi:hypothetical protein
MRSKIPYVILALLFVGYILLETFGPQPADWGESYTKDKATAFGCKLVYERLPDLFPDKKIQVVEESATKVLKEFEKRPTNYIIIDDRFKTDQYEAKALIDFVSRGNNVFIASQIFEGGLADSLHLNNESIYWGLLKTEQEPAKNDYLVFDQTIDSDQKHYPLLDNVVYNHFPFWHNGVVLAKNKDEEPMFVAVEMGEGHFYVHSVPLLFTNYSMVDPINQGYISKALSMLPDADVIWDEYYKPGKVHTKSTVAFLLDQRSLKWAWFTTLAGLLLFMVFESKRKQRIIPVMEPPANTTLEFTHTVGNLYFAHGDHKDIAEKKIKFMMEYIRNRWGLPTQEYNSDFKERLASKSGVHRMEIESLCTLMEKIHNAKSIDESSLQQLSIGIDGFYRQTK